MDYTESWGFQLSVFKLIFSRQRFHSNLLKFEQMFKGDTTCVKNGHGYSTQAWLSA